MLTPNGGVSGEYKALLAYSHFKYRLISSSVIFGAPIENQFMITNTKQLKDTLHNQRYGHEIIKKSLATDRKLKLLEFYWITSHADCTTFAITVTFVSARQTQFAF